MRRVGIVRIGGLSALLAAVAYVVAVILEAASPAGRADSFSAFLTAASDDKLYAASAWALVMALLLALPTALALLHVLHYVGSFVWLPVAAFVAGVTLGFVQIGVRLGIAYSLADHYVEAAGAQAALLEQAGQTLASVGTVIGSIAVLLAVTVGIGLFSLVIAFLADLPPRWLGWWGLAVAALGILVAVPLQAPLLREIAGLGLVVWLVGVGSWLVGLREPLEAK